MKIAKVVDQFGWAYYFLDKEQQKYSKHEIIIYKHNQVDLNSLDAVYIHGPDISPEALELCHEARRKGVKVIGGHAGPVLNLQPYPYLDLAVGISPQTFEFCKEHYNCPSVFLPEGIDTDFFRPIKREQPVSTWIRGKWKCAGEKLPIPSISKRNSVRRVNLASVNNRMIFQSDHIRDGKMWISGNLSVNQANRNVNIGIMKNANNLIISPFTVRTATSGQAYPFSIVAHIKETKKDDFFGIWLTSTNNGDVVTLTDVYWFADWR